MPCCEKEMNNGFESYISRLSLTGSSDCRYVWLTVYSFHTAVIESNATFTYTVPCRTKLLRDFLAFTIPTLEDASCVLDCMSVFCLPISSFFPHFLDIRLLSPPPLGALSYVCFVFYFLYVQTIFRITFSGCR